MRKKYSRFMDNITPERSDEELFKSVLAKAGKKEKIKMTEKKILKKAVMIPVAAAAALALSVAGGAAIYNGVSHLRSSEIAQSPEVAESIQTEITRLTEEGLPGEEIRELIHIAHEEGFSVMAHCNGARTAEAAAAAGVDSVEHGAYLDGEALAAMAENRVIWCPTLSTIGNLRGTGRFDETAVAKILDSALENVSRYFALGGTVAPGSDAGAWQVFHGGDTEYELLRTVLPDEAIKKGAQAVIDRF